MSEEELICFYCYDCGATDPCILKFINHIYSIPDNCPFGGEGNWKLKEEG